MQNQETTAVLFMLTIVLMLGAPTLVYWAMKGLHPLLRAGLALGVGVVILITVVQPIFKGGVLEQMEKISPME